MGSKSLQVGEHMEVKGEWRAWREHGSSMPLPHTLPYACISSIWLFLGYILL